jgi:hypothetical protein
MNEKILVSTGNMKMKEVLIFNLPAMVTCPNRTAMCENRCYAKKAERLYPQTLPARQRNLNESMTENFVADMIEKIEYMNSRRKQYKLFRIHESGDFYNEAYFKQWLTIIKYFPNIQFLAFTKSTFVKKYVDELPSNFNLYYSIWEDSKKENIVYELPLAIAGNCSKLYNKEVFECKGKCNECYHCFTKRKDVHFAIH